jgi:hypothetical protein
MLILLCSWQQIWSQKTHCERKGQCCTITATISADPGHDPTQRGCLREIWDMQKTHMCINTHVWNRTNISTHQML